MCFPRTSSNSDSLVSKLIESEDKKRTRPLTTCPQFAQTVPACPTVSGGAMLFSCPVFGRVLLPDKGGLPRESAGFVVPINESAGFVVPINESAGFVVPINSVLFNLSCVWVLAFYCGWHL